jgi:hypothetical protein
MKNNTTETRSGNKRPNVFLHYITASVLLMLTASAVTPSTESSAYAMPPGGVVPAAAVKMQVPSNKLETLLGARPVTLREYSLELQVDTLEDKLEKADERIDQKIEEIEAEFEKYENVDALITKLHTYVGKSPYVLSGVGPTGWDCSGLVMWFYKQYKGYYLEHRASAQANGGKVVDAPIPGDIVAFTYKGSKSAYHVGIYVGGGFMIHAKNRGEDTVLESVDKFAGKNNKVAYIRY